MICIAGARVKIIQIVNIDVYTDIFQLILRIWVVLRIRPKRGSK